MTVNYSHIIKLQNFKVYALFAHEKKMVRMGNVLANSQRKDVPTYANGLTTKKWHLTEVFWTDENPT